MDRRVTLAFARFDAAELEFCRYLNRSSRSFAVRQLFRAVSWLGDGWIWYAAILALPLTLGIEGLQSPVTPALVSRGRPANRPQRRLAGLAALYLRAGSDLRSHALGSVAAATRAGDLIASWQAAADGVSLLGPDRRGSSCSTSSSPSRFWSRCSQGRRWRRQRRYPPRPPMARRASSKRTWRLRKASAPSAAPWRSRACCPCWGNGAARAGAGGARCRGRTSAPRGRSRPLPSGYETPSWASSLRAMRLRSAAMRRLRKNSLMGLKMRIGAGPSMVRITFVTNTPPSAGSNSMTWR